MPGPWASVQESPYIKLPIVIGLAHSARIIRISIWQVKGGCGLTNTMEFWFIRYKTLCFKDSVNRQRWVGHPTICFNSTGLEVRQNVSPLTALSRCKPKWLTGQNGGRLKMEAIMRLLTIWPLLHSSKQSALRAACIWRQQCICDGKTSGGSGQPQPNPQTLVQSIEFLLFSL